MTRQSFKPIPGDVIVESVGKDLRMWEVIEKDAKIKIRHVATSNTFRGLRYVTFVSGSRPMLSEASAYTVAKIYKGDAKFVIDAMQALFDAPVRRVHLYYAGRGPSGNLWGDPFTRDEQTHYTLDREESPAVPE